MFLSKSPGLSTQLSIQEKRGDNSLEEILTFWIHQCVKDLNFPLICSHKIEYWGKLDNT